MSKVPNGFEAIPFVDVAALAKEQRAKMKAKDEEITLTLTKAGAEQFANAAEQISMMLGYAETAFCFLGRLHGDRDHVGHLGFEAVCVLCERALASIGEKEGVTVEHLVSHLRRNQTQEEAE